MSILRIINGGIRLFFGFCPKCNSDAPELYDCKVCNWYQTSFSGMPDKETKAIWWDRFIKDLKKEKGR